jgi:hypothetical protein
MNRDQGPSQHPTEALDLHAATGVWAVRSVSNTVYYVDLDRSLLLRLPGQGSTTGPYDGQWVQLVEVRGLDYVGQVRVGHRHRYLTDPVPNTPTPYRWWIQRTVTAIDQVEVRHAAALRDDPQKATMPMKGRTLMTTARGPAGGVLRRPAWHRGGPRPRWASS